MVRTGFLIAVATVALWAPAQAQNGPPDSEDGRFTFHRIEDGYLRLDGRSGQVSTCARRAAGWLCQAVADERGALEAEIARLQTENVNLKRELLSHNLALPGGVTGGAAAGKTADPAVKLPSDAELDRVMTFVEKVWRRMVDMIVTTQKDILKKP